MLRRSIPRALVLAFLVPGALCALQEAPLTPEDGARAPEGTWPMVGGSAARTGATLSQPVRLPTQEAWSRKLLGKIESEPLVWDEQIFVALEKGTGKRSLVTIELASGKLTAEFKSDGDVPLAPSVSRSLAVVSGTNWVDVLRWTSSELEPINRIDYEGEVTSTLLFDDELYIAGSAGVRRVQPFSGTGVWEVPGTVRGQLALRGDHVYALFDEGAGSCHLSALTRMSGEAESTLGVLFSEGPSNVDLAVLKDSVFLRATEHIELSEYETPPVRNLVVSRNLGNGELSLPFGHGTIARAPSEWQGGWVAHADDESKTLLFCGNAAGRRATEISKPRREKTFFNDSGVSITGNVVHAGGGTFEVPTLRVLARADEIPTFRPVPARDALIHVRGESTLVVLREPKSEGVAFVAPEAEEKRLPGRVLLANSSIENGEYELLVKEGVLNRFDRRDKREAIKLTDVRMFETEGGTLAYAADLGAIESDWRRVASSELAERYAELALQARSTNDVDLIRRLMHDARAHGSDDSFDRVIDALAKLEKRPAKTKANKARGIAQKADDLESPAARLWKRFNSLAADTPGDVRLALLRAILQETPDHTEAGAKVAELVPEGLRDAANANPLGWLEYVEVAESHGVAQVDVAADESSATAEQRMIVRMRSRWRPDLIAVRSECFFILAPPSAPQGIANIVRYGELICEALADMLPAPEAATVNPPSLMSVHVYESASEYNQFVDGREPGLGLTWAQCLYSPRSHALEVYLPADESAMARAVPALAHQLAHQWMRETSPLTRASGGRVEAQIRGYWVVEGLASMLEDFEFDVLSGTWSTSDPRSNRLDLVAGAPEEYLLPWSKVFKTSFREFGGMSRNRKYPVVKHWTLGIPEKTSKANFFYGQAAATCQYLLHADDGAHRPQLASFLSAYYSGDETVSDATKHFGLDADELGKRVRDYAQSVSRPER